MATASFDTSGDRLLSIDEAASILGVSKGTLDVWRSTKRYDLAFVRIGGRIKYRLRDVLDWIEKRTVPGV